MIRGFEQPHPAEPIGSSRWQGMPALGAGLIAGVVLLFVPHASPWSGVSTFTPAIMGRVPPPTSNLGPLLMVIVHLALAIIYGLLISLVIIKIHGLRAVLLGGLLGLILYRLNLTAVSLWFPTLRGNEVSVIVTHVVFGLMAAGLYRGLLRRRVPTESSQNPPPPAVPPIR